MNHSEKLAPVAGAIAALSTMACCLPMGFAAAIVSASVGAVVAEYQQWFLAASVLLVAVGGLQLRRKGRACARRPYASIVVWALSAAVVLLVLFFPQVIAGLVADWTS